MIEFALPSDEKEIMEIWEAVFPEDKSFNKWFFKNKFKREYTLVYRGNGVVCSMVQLLPYEIAGFGKVSYIYGAATKPEFRKRGIMRELLEYSHGLDRERGFSGSVLIPANRELFNYYGKIGYKTAFFVAHSEYSTDKTDGFAVKRAEKEDISALNEIYINEIGKSYVVRTYDRWLEQLNMFDKIYDGCYILTENGREKAYCFCANDSVAEICGTNKGELCARINSGKPVQCTEKGNKIPYGMLLSYTGQTPENMYIGLMFD